MSQIPTTLGKYQIIREIARSNDIVYEAYDPAMNRRVAVKELAVPAGATPQQREDRIRRFQREVKAAGSLSHPNIVTIFEVGEDAGRHFMAMEYLEGHTLRNELDSRGLVPPDRAAEIAAEVLAALDFAHRHGVVHRDVKPENIQLLDDGRVKLTDFGIARLTFEPNLTMDGQVFGTPSYMSPEQVVGKEIDARSDLFSVGVVLYEMVSGRKPFAGDSVVAITYAIMNSQPDSLPDLRLWEIVRRAIEKTPSMRFPDARTMIEAIKSPFVAPSFQPSYQVPYQHQPLPPAPSYPYNPYVVPGSTASSIPSPASGIPYQPPVPPPIYTPRPPRRPVLSARQRIVGAKIVATLMLLGALTAAFILGIDRLSTAVGQSRSAASDSRSRALARDHMETARRQAQMNEWEGAFRSLAEAAAHDPFDPAYSRQEALWLAELAQRAPLEQQSGLWTRSAEAWKRTAAISSAADRPGILNAAAECLVNAALVDLGYDRRAEALDKLYEARRYAAPGGAAAAEIDRLIGGRG